MEEIRLNRFRVTSPVAVGIIDPYTGDELVVEGVVRGSAVTFSAPDAFTLAEPQKDVRTLYARASMRNGVEGVVSREESLKCAYTGKPLRLEHLKDGPPKVTMREPLKGEAVDRPDTECVGEELNEVAEKTVKALGADRGRTTVSMSRKGRK